MGSITRAAGAMLLYCSMVRTCFFTLPMMASRSCACVEAANSGGRRAGVRAACKAQQLLLHMPAQQRHMHAQARQQRPPLTLYTDCPMLVMMERV